MRTGNTFSVFCNITYWVFVIYCNCITYQANDVTSGHSEMPAVSSYGTITLAVTKFFHKITTQDMSWRLSTPLQSWAGIKFGIENGNLVSIALLRDQHRRVLRGNLSWEWLPSTTRYLDLSDNELGGDINLSDRHRSLQTCFLRRNTFSRSIDFTLLPSELRVLQIQSNQLDGHIDLTSLPPKLALLTAQENTFNGDVFLQFLPSFILQLDLSVNRLDGPLDLAHLPSAVQRVYLSSNCFCGKLFLLSLPPQLLHLCVEKNHFWGNIDLSALPESLCRLRLHGNYLRGVITASELSSKLELTVDASVEVIRSYNPFSQPTIKIV